MPAVSLDGQPIVLRGPDVADFRESLAGSVLLREDKDYEQARRVWNGAIDRKPALIAYCADANDVVRSVNFARDHRLLLAVRCGGHSSAGRGVCDGGLVLDLSPMRTVTVDPGKRTAHVQGGALLGDFDRAAQAHRLVATAGTVSHTGIGGLTLGGGLGHLQRQFGLTIDSLIGAEVVTADGKLMRASEQQNPDLFWGIRGGGGNFGVVTAFDFRLHPFGPSLHAAELVYPLQSAQKVLEFIAEYGEELPDDAVLEPTLISTPDNTRILSLGLLHSGSIEATRKYVEPILRLVKPLNSSIEETLYLDMQTKRDGESAPGQQGYLKSAFLPKLSAQAIDAMLGGMEEATLPMVQVIALPQTGGAASRVDARATAFPHRDAKYMMLFNAAWRDPGLTDPYLAWARKTWKATEPATRGVYVNFLASDDPSARVREAYGVNYDRMVATKNKYDPTNLFRMNVNVQPTV